MKKSIRALLALLLAMTLVLGLAACGGDETPSDEPSGEPSDKASDDPSEAPSDEPSADPTEDVDTPTGSIDMSIPEGTELGSRIADFTFTTYDGKEMSLYETLAEKKMVLINIWATWCGPCKMEFPYMTEAYEEYKDNLEIFALSCEPEDTDDVLADYVADMGMTFPVGSDSADLNVLFKVDAIPTSIVVDRFGVICLIEAGSQDSTATFERLFDVFVADDYTESVLLTDGIPGPKPDFDAEDPADIATALLSNPNGITVANPEDEYNFPMLLADKGGERQYLVSSNAGLDGTYSMIDLTVEAKAGDVLLFDYMTSTEEHYDYLYLTVNGEPKMAFSGENDWTTWAYQFEEAGTYDVSFAYIKDEASSEGDDVAAVDEVRLVSEADGAEYLAAQPVYPISESDTIVPAGGNTTEIVINDPSGTLEYYFPNARYYIIPGETVMFNVTLAGIPQQAYFYFENEYEYDYLFLDEDDIAGDCYLLSIASDEDSLYTSVQLYPNAESDGETVLYFPSLEHLNSFLVSIFANDDGTLAATWRYANGNTADVVGVMDDVLADDEALYYLSFVDQNGDPVPGVTANVCDDASCQPMVSDENGMIGFVFPAFAYHIEVLKVPDGYEYDTANVLYTEAESGILEFVLTKK